MKRNLYTVRNYLESLMFGMITNVSFPWILRKPVIDQKSSFVLTLSLRYTHETSTVN